MKIWTVNALQISLIIISIIILGACVFVLPMLARESVVANPEYGYLQYPVLIGIYLTAVPFYFGIFNGFKLLNLIKKDIVFSEAANKALSIIIYSTTSVIFIYIVGMVYLGFQNALHPGLSLLGLGIIFAAFILTIFAMLIKALLVKIIEIKNENDLTI